MGDGVQREQLPWYRWVFELVKAAVEEFGADAAGRTGAALAFYSLFALVPLLFLTSAVAGFVLEEASLDRVMGQVESVVGGVVAEQIRSLLESVVRTSGTSLLIGIPLAAFSGSAIVVQVQRVLNEIFHAPEPEQQGISRTILQRLLAALVSLVLTLLVLTPIVAVAAVQFVVGLLPAEAEWVTPILRLGVPFASVLLLIVVVGVTFQLFTRHEIPWAAARRGGLVTGLTLLAAAYLVGLYLRIQEPQEGGGINALGVIGGVAILLFFFNLLWQVYLFGAELTKVYVDYLEHGDIATPSDRARRLERTGEEQERKRRVDAGEEAPPRSEGQAEVLARVGLAALLVGVALRWARRG